MNRMPRQSAGVTMRRREFLLGAAALALSRDKIDAAQALIEAAAARGDVSAAVLYVRQGNLSFARTFGCARNTRPPR